MTAKTKAESTLLAATLIWGGTFVVVKIGMQEVSPILLVAIRFLIAPLVILALFWRSIFPIRAASLVKGSILGFFLFLGFVAQNIGLTITTASKSAFITGMMVIFVPVLQFIIEKKGPRLGNVVGVLLVALGLWYLTSPAGAAFNKGDALTFLCAIFFAVYIVYLDVVSKEMPTEQLVFVQMISTGVLSWIAVGLFEKPVLVFSAMSVATILYLTIFATVLTTYIQTRFQKETTPTRAVIIFSVEPVIASVVAYLVLKEELGALGILGGILILSGILVSELSDTVPVLNKTFDASDS